MFNLYHTEAKPNTVAWKQVYFDELKPLSIYKDLDFTNNLIMNDTTLNYINNFFSKTGENESLLYLYGYKEGNKTFITDAEYKSYGIISTNQTHVQFWMGNKSNTLGYIHIHPKMYCVLSGKDLEISDIYNQTIMLYCNGMILYYDGIYKLQNISNIARPEGLAGGYK
jgi:hypothetical protein